MRRIEFVWDERKARSNLLKHGVAFDDARYVFNDLEARFQPDRVVGGEERWHAIGWARAFALLIVTYVTWDEEDGTEVYRLVSARPVTRAERWNYEEEAS